MSREGEMVASEQMRDRAVALLTREADVRERRGNSSGRTRAALLRGMAHQVAALPAQAAKEG